MNTKGRLVLILTLVLLPGVALWAVLIQAAPGAASMADGTPTVVAYQGELRESGALYNDDGYFKFAFVSAAGAATYWSNDGTSTGGGEPTAAVQLAVSEGLFSVLLGDTSLSGMTQALTADVFSQPDRYLRVWFSASTGGPFSQLTPDTRIAAVPYALQAQEAVNADTVDGLHANQLETHYQNVVVVAQSGGDYTSVQAAIDSTNGSAADNPFLVWVAPGVYSETVIMKPFVHLQGAGQEATIITSSVSNSVWPPTEATLVLASDTSLRDLTVGNGGTVDGSLALLATAGMTRTLVADVTARAQGGSASNYAIFLSGSGTGVTLQQVSALAEEASGNNAGLFNFDHAAAFLYGGNYTARGGTNAYGIFNIVTATLEVNNVIALGENGTNLNVGLYNHNSAAAVLRGGVFTGRGGNQTGGVANQQASTLTAEDITVLAENGSDNYGLGNYDDAVLTVRGAAVIARGGTNNYALSNEFNVTLEAESITALAENGSSANHGFWNVNNAQATARGGSFTGRGGTNAYGIYSANDGTMLEAESVTALGKDGTDENYGLFNSGQYNSDIVTTMLRNSSFTGDSGTYAYGIYISGTLTTLAGESITVLGKDGSSTNYGFYNEGGAATADSSQFTGSNNGLYQVTGTMSLGATQLDGDATRAGGTLTCFQVYDGSYAAYTCP